jgi:beta-1,3-galactosyl-O-glycosyl-glycoprotein beta-1,6-N-acetylglucosaminyltransferase/N-acetyllactosaminide beta-1,6-N-acetylglucosaminyltransferase
MTSNQSQFQYKRPIEVEDLNCQILFDGSTEAINEYVKKRIKIEDPEWSELPMDCESIKERNYFQTKNIYNEEKTFPIAFSRAVFKDYRFLEMELSSTYAPRNFYCYAIDSKAPWIFRSRMQALANCFPNVYITHHEFEMDSMGNNTYNSEMECIRILSKFEWEYVIFLQVRLEDKAIMLII